MAHAPGVTAEDVVRMHDPLARIIAGRYAARTKAFEFDDLLQEAHLALVQRHAICPSDDMRGGLAGKIMARRLSSLLNPADRRTWAGAPKVSPKAREFDAMRVSTSLEAVTEGGSESTVGNAFAAALRRSAHPSSEEEIMHEESERQLMLLKLGLVGKYTDRRRGVALLFILDGLTATEIAPMLGITRQAVSLHIQVIKRELREALREHMEERA